jgi:hypothetical protein
MFMIYDDENQTWATMSDGELSWATCDCGALKFDTMEDALAFCEANDIDPGWVIAV